MSAADAFKKYFAPDALTEIYFQKIQQNAPVGLDRINRRSFEARLSENIAAASRKVKNGSYEFTQYKEKLLLKGRESLPRIICIPTIRDKVVLKGLHQVLQDVYNPALIVPAIHTVVNEAKLSTQSGTYSHFWRLDIKDFFPSVDHELLQRKLARNIRKPEIISLILKAISQSTLSKSERLAETRKTKGIPQGLSISNILANVFLADLDTKHKGQDRYGYFRYVDDFLILSSEANIERVASLVKSDLVSMGLEANPGKERSGSISEGFPYLGYHFSDRVITVRTESIEKLISSLIETLAQHKYSRNQEIQILLWKLNLRLTGCRFDGEKYGWMFFFSQIDDFALLFRIDAVLRSLMKRFQVDASSNKLRRLSRTFREIIHNLSRTKYIPDFDQYTVTQKRTVLDEIFKMANVDNLEEHLVESHFRGKIFKMIKDLERDISRAS